MQINCKATMQCKKLQSYNTNKLQSYNAVQKTAKLQYNAKNCK